MGAFSALRDRQRSTFLVKAPAIAVSIQSRLRPEKVPSCAEGGVLGVLPGTVGLMQATEVVKLILGEGKPLIGRVLLYDAMDMKFRELKLRRDSECPVCGDNPTVTELIDYQQFCGLPSQGEAAG